MDKIRTLSLKQRISSSYGSLLNARNSGSIALYDKALFSYQELLTEFLENTQRENDLIRFQLEENQKILDAQFKYKNCLNVVR